MQETLLTLSSGKQGMMGAITTLAQCITDGPTKKNDDNIIDGVPLTVKEFEFKRKYFDTRVQNESDKNDIDIKEKN